MTIRERSAPKIPNKKYLLPPLESYKSITEGFIYTQAEKRFHGNYYHKAVDYEVEYGMPVFAAADGYAVASYHRYVVHDKYGVIQLFDGKPIGNGLGFFVQIYHPEDVCGVKGGRITQYGHLSFIDPMIKLKETKILDYDLVERIRRKNRQRRSTRLSDSKLRYKVARQKRILKDFPWAGELYGYNFSGTLEERDSYTYTFNEVMKLYKQGDKYVSKVKQGEKIGEIGLSAILWGKPNYKEGKGGQRCKKFKAWDETHLHFEEAARDPKTLIKHSQRDPYDIYKGYRWYQKEANWGKNQLFMK